MSVGVAALDFVDVDVGNPGGVVHIYVIPSVAVAAIEEARALRLLTWFALSLTEQSISCGSAGACAQLYGSCESHTPIITTCPH